MNKNILYGGFAAVVIMSFYFIYKGDLLFLITAALSLLGFMLISKNVKAASVLIGLGAVVSAVLLLLPDGEEISTEDESPANEVVNNQQENNQQKVNPVVSPPVQTNNISPEESGRNERPDINSPSNEILNRESNSPSDYQSQPGESHSVQSNSLNHDEAYKTQEEITRETYHKEKSNYKPTPVENPEKYIPSGWASSLLSGSPNTNVNQSSTIPSPSNNTSPASNIATPSATYSNCEDLNRVHSDGVPSSHPSYSKDLDGNNNNWACEK